MTEFRIEGRAAGRAAKPSSANPYRRGTLARAEWEIGWAMGADERQAELGVVDPARGQAGRVIVNREWTSGTWRWEIVDDQSGISLASRGGYLMEHEARADGEAVRRTVAVPPAPTGAGP